MKQKGVMRIDWGHLTFENETRNVNSFIGLSKADGNVLQFAFIQNLDGNIASVKTDGRRNLHSS